MVESVSAAGSVEAPVTRHVLDNHTRVAIDDARLLFQGDYAREGHDLLISYGGRTVVVENYFIADDGPSLAGPNGAFLSHETVSALAGPMAPAQYAQAGAASGLVEIGKIVKLSGTARSQHPDGTEVELALDDPVYQGDVLSTGPDSSLGISFVDKSVFSMSADARMVLDELVYDPGDAENSSMVFNLVEGAFVFVTGEIAPTGNMKVETPVATMGIRGTTPKVLINTALGVVEFTILPDPDSGKIGVYQIVNRETGAIMGTVESSGDKWVVTTLTNEAVRIAKTGLDLLNDQIALDEIRDVFSRALGDRTQLDGTTSFGNVSFDSNASDGNGNGEGDENGQGGGTGGNVGGEDGTLDADDPPIAGDDAFTLDEDSFVVANVIDGSVGGADTDPDGFALKVSAIDGAPLVFAPDGFATVSLPSGAVLKMNAAGNFNYDPLDAFDYLAIGEQELDTFTYTVRDAGGFTDTATVTVTVQGRNDQPEITPGVVTGTITDVDEAPDVPPQNNFGDLTATGSIDFTDIDLTDRPTATEATVSVTATAQGGGVLPLTAAQIAAIEAAFTISPAAGNANDGTINWDYTIAESDLDFLGADEQVVVTFRITVNDNSGAVAGVDNNESPIATQDVVITINGSQDDAPVITPVVVTGALSDIAELDPDNPGASDATVLQATGSIDFADVDLTDRPVATEATKSVTAVQQGGAPLALTAPQQAAFEAAFTIDPNGTSGVNTNDGTVTWGFSIAEAEVDFLAAGEVVTAVFTITVTDDEGNTDTQDVTITITGANDTPVITVGAGDDVDATLAEAETAITASGSFSVSDVDVTDVVTVKEMTVATSGDDSGAPGNTALLAMMALTPAQLGTIIDGVSTTGSVGWTFDSGPDQFDYLALGEQLTLTYTVTVTDDKGAEDTQDIVITVTGTNDAPILTLDTSGGVTEDAASPDLTATGALSFMDVDVSDTHTITESFNNDAVWSGGTLTAQQIADLTSGFIADADSWDYTVANADVQFLGAGETVTFSHDVTVTDDSGEANNSDTETVTITITGTNDAPVIDVAPETITINFTAVLFAGYGSIAGGETISGTLAINAQTGEGISLGVAHTTGGSYFSDEININILNDAFSNTADVIVVQGLNLDGALGGIAPGTASLNLDLRGPATVLDSTDLPTDPAIWNALNDRTLQMPDPGDAEPRNAVTGVGTIDPFPEFLVAGPATGQITELTDADAGHNTAIHTATGTIEFSDVDISDTHTLTWAPDGGNPIDLPSAAFATTAPTTTDTTTNGSFGWAFTVDDADLDFLAEGETRVFNYTLALDDGNGSTDEQVVTVTITGTNDAPVVTAGGTVDWQIGDGAKVIDGAITVSDVDSPDLVGATVTISGNHAPDDMLGFVDQSSISGDFNATTGVLTLTGAASVADYQTALRSITFTTSGYPPSGGAREISFVVNDGHDDSIAATSTVTVESFNQIDGTASAETLDGTAASDIIFGLGGDDDIDGLDGRDILVGGEGADTLTGGDGGDIFVFDDTSLGALVDTITDFNIAEDFIDLEALLSAAFDDQNPGTEITFAENVPGNVIMSVNGDEIANLGGLAFGTDSINVIYDQAEAHIPVAVA